LLYKNLNIKKYRTVVLYGCETLSLTLRVYENRVLKRIFGDRKEEVTGEWRKLHNEELNDLYSSPNIDWVIKLTKIRWAGHIVRMGRGEEYKGKRLLGRPRRRWEDNIKMDLQEAGRVGMDWIELAQDRGRWRELVNAEMNLRVP
jgi:hypothetical protein